MIQRLRIGILYAYNENWIGSTYYIQNLICALNLLDDEGKPEIMVVTREPGEYERLKRLTGYPYLNFKKLTLAERIINNLVPSFFFPRLLRNFLLGRHYSDIDVIFPATHGVSFSLCKNQLYWIADFQEHFLTSFFSKKEFEKRKSIQQRIVDRAKFLVLSSRGALADFNTIYPDNKVRQFVLPFAVTHPVLPVTDKPALCKKYQIPDQYFICSNQFWKHKNHEVVLKALGELKSKGKDIFIVFTGKVHDYRNPLYFDELNLIVKEMGLEQQVRFLGFISREDQLLLMKSSVAVIQPSLFEGWSTVVEDAKALHARIIVSSIPVHEEQLVSYSGKIFFDPHNYSELADAIAYMEKNHETVSYDYQSDIIQYSKAFNAVVHEIIQAQTANKNS